eukprot:SAG31_NODE_1528_length_8003_cov_1.749620_4_plen_815_part_00
MHQRDMIPMYQLYRRRPMPRRDKAYMILPASYDFRNAESTCNKIGGNLASLHGDEDVSAMLKLNWFWGTESKRGLWIGLHQLGGRELSNRIKYRWTDGSDLDYGVDRWSADQPVGNPRMQCVSLRTNGRFEARPCEDEQEAVCVLDGYLSRASTGAVYALGVAGGAHPCPHGYEHINNTRTCAEASQMLGFIYESSFVNVAEFSSPRGEISRVCVLQSIRYVTYMSNTTHGFDVPVCIATHFARVAPLAEHPVTSRFESNGDNGIHRAVLLPHSKGVHTISASQDGRDLPSLHVQIEPVQCLHSQIPTLDGGVCLCRPGYGAVGDECMFCEPGFRPPYFADDQTNECVQCDTSQVSSDGLECIPCAPGKKPDIQLSSDGRTGIQAYCAGCDANEISAHGLSCEPCPGPLVPSDDHTSCVHCPENSVKSANNDGSCSVCQSGRAPLHRCSKIRIPLPQHAMLHQGCNDNDNVALLKNATMSSTKFGAEASRAVDGNADGFSTNFCAHSDMASADSGEWWQVDLRIPHTIRSVEIVSTMMDQFHSATVILSSSPDFSAVDVTQCGEALVGIAAVQTIHCDPSDVRAQYVTVAQHNLDSDYLVLCEVRVFADCDHVTETAVGSATLFEGTADSELRCDTEVSGPSNISFKIITHDVESWEIWGNSSGAANHLLELHDSLQRRQEIVAVAPYSADLGVNLARQPGIKTWQSSTAWGGSSSAAVDGRGKGGAFLDSNLNLAQLNINAETQNHTDVVCTHSHLPDTSPWWQLDLGEHRSIGMIRRCPQFLHQRRTCFSYVRGCCFRGLPSHRSRSPIRWS